MRPKTRGVIVFGLLIFAVLSTNSIFKSLQTYSSPRRMDHKQEGREFQVPQEPNTEFSDMLWDENPTERLQLNGLGTNKIVNCWPSVGEIIIGTHLNSVELDCLKLPRFESVQRAYSTTEEDEFYRQFRKVGGKWWSSYGDYQMAVGMRNRPSTSTEKEGLLLGWPADGEFGL
jgi:hypothetical protein